jgi:murein DD-endopeptidase MepM/ murein hydrolase activator NlpD
MQLSRRAFVAALAVVSVLVALPAGAAVSTSSTKDELDAARSRLAEARAQAGAAAADLSRAENQLAATEQHVAQLEATIAAAKARAATLRAIVRERALYAYTHGRQKLDLLMTAEDPVDGIRKQRLLDQANQTDNDAARKLAAIDQDLREQQSELRDQEAQQRAVTAELDRHASALAAAQADQQAATDALQQKYDEEIAIAAEAERARLENERAQLAASRVGTGGGAAGQVIVNPGGGSFMCPISGAAYSDDFGGARGHKGIDMFAPTGTPAVAVKSGAVSFVPNAGAGGNEAYLAGSDGNTYYYAHFSSYAGGARSVVQGEIIGYTGMTGNASAPHLHFEIRLGGPNGQRTNPYPTLSSAGC